MLFSPYEEARLRRWRAPYCIQPKLDGERCRAEISHGEVKLVSSELNEFTLVPHISEELRRLGYDNIELDGELYLHGKDFSAIHSIVSRRANIHDEWNNMQYHIFDVIDESAIQLDRLDQLLDFPESEFIKIVPTLIVDTVNEIFEHLDRFTNAGYEGFILRELSAPYIRRRSTFGMKFKPGKEDVYTITGFKEEKDQYGAKKGTLGAIQFQGEDYSTGWVGSGLTKADRARYWTAPYPSALIGKKVRVKYQHLTKKNGVPRSSVFVEIL
jgi:ATP-dependent DNA ligase